jgi:hypothetical protein
MDKEQAINSFWNSFDVPAYDMNTVPDDAPFPRITYEVTVNEFGNPTTVYASIWDKNTGWGRITGIAHKIDSALSEGGHTVSYDGGIIWLKKGTPFQQRMGDPDDTIRRILVNIEIEYLEGKR